MKNDNLSKKKSNQNLFSSILFVVGGLLLALIVAILLKSFGFTEGDIKIGAGVSMGIGIGMGMSKIFELISIKNSNDKI